MGRLRVTSPGSAWERVSGSRLRRSNAPAHVPSQGQPWLRARQDGRTGVVGAGGPVAPSPGDQHHGPVRPSRRSTPIETWLALSRGRCARSRRTAADATASSSVGSGGVSSPAAEPGRILMYAASLHGTRGSFCFSHLLCRPFAGQDRGVPRCRVAQAESAFRARSPPAGPAGQIPCDGARRGRSRARPHPQTPEPAPGARSTRRSPARAGGSATVGQVTRLPLRWVFPCAGRRSESLQGRSSRHLSSISRVMAGWCRW